MNKDVISSISLHLPYGDIQKVCSTSERYKEIICNNEVFWENKIDKDFPGFKRRYMEETLDNLEGKSSEEIYQKLRRKYGVKNMKLNISLYDMSKTSKTEESKDINISINIKSDNIEKVGKILLDGINSFLSSENIIGKYTLYVNGHLFCKSKTTGFVRLEKNCFNGLTGDSNIYLRIGMKNFSYLRRDRYQKSLEENMDYSVRSV